jgi:hypothetical protein
VILAIGFDGGALLTVVQYMKDTKSPKATPRTNVIK